MEKFNNYEARENSPKNPQIPNEIKLFAEQKTPELKKTLENLGYQTEQNIANISNQTRLKILGGSIATNNDNHMALNGKTTGADDGRSFGFDANILMDYNGRPFELSAKMDSYTSLPNFVDTNTGFTATANYEWAPGTGERVDRGEIKLLTKTPFYTGEKLQVNGIYGGGISYTGDLGGEQIQNKWHDAIGLDYHVKAPYEAEKWFGAFAHVGMDARYKINEYIYTGARAHGHITLAGKWNSHAEVGVYGGVKTKYAELEAGITERMVNNESSRTIAFAQTPQNGMYNYVKAAVWSENMKLFYKVSSEDSGQWTIGLQFGKKF